MFPQALLLTIIISIISKIGHSNEMGVQFKDFRKTTTCTKELMNANETLINWAGTLKKIIVERAPNNSSNSSSSFVLSEEDKIQKLVVKFGNDMNRKPIEQLVKDLVLIRKKSNRLALDIYFKTFDMIWPKTSVQLGVSVERVQKACLPNIDRQAMMVFNSPTSSSLLSYLNQRS